MDVLEINQHNFSGVLTSDPTLDVIKSKMSGEGKTIVTFDLVYNHPHDLMKKEKRSQYLHVRLYGKTAEAANRNLVKGDEVFVAGAVRVQDMWVNETTKRTHRKAFFEPPPFGLKYTRCLKFGTRRLREVDDEKSD